MKTIFKYLFLMLLAFTLSACRHDAQSYTYYLLHPDVLPKIINQCQKQQPSSQEDALRCQTAYYAARKVMALASAAESQPEFFGEKILRAQMQYQILEQTWHDAEIRLNDLKQQHADEALIRTANDDVLKAKQACDEAKQLIQMNLAVVGLASPE